jgi:YegS/Rv2252/BmrU family lipid kinase
VQHAFRAAGVRFEAAFTREAGEATALAERAPARHGLVVAVGGDGTVHEVANGLLRASREGETMPMAIIPLGGGDDFVKALRPGPRGARAPDAGREAAGRIAAGRTALYDVARLETDRTRAGMPGGPRYVVNLMDVGFGAQTLVNLGTARKLAAGRLAYLIAALRALRDARPLPLQVELDGHRAWAGATAMVAVANGPCFGGGFWICPEARPDDALLDVLIAQAAGRLTLLRLMSKVLKGAHGGEATVRMHRARRVTLEADEPAAVEADGQLLALDARRVEVQVLPRRLRLIV